MWPTWKKASSADWIRGRPPACSSNPTGPGWDTVQKMSAAPSLEELKRLREHRRFSSPNWDLSHFLYYFSFSASAPFFLVGALTLAFPSVILCKRFHKCVVRASGLIYEKNTSWPRQIYNFKKKTYSPHLLGADYWEAKALMANFHFFLAQFLLSLIHAFVFIFVFNIKEW